MERLAQGKGYDGGKEPVKNTSEESGFQEVSSCNLSIS